MDWIKGFQLILFDFDGLLVDTEKLHFAAYRQMCQRHGCDWQWDYRQYCYRAHSRASGIWYALRSEFPKLFEQGLSEKELYNEKKEIYFHLIKTTPLELMEGVEPLLSALAKTDIKRAVVTNSLRSQIDQIKTSLPILNAIPVWITREEYENPKPAPDGYLKAIEQLGSPGDRVIGFEDTLKGLKSLVAAGVEGVLICPKELEHVKECLALGARHSESFSSFKPNRT